MKMRWNAFENISPAIDKTKELLFPFRLSYWMKLGFVSMLGSRAGSRGPSFNFSNGISTSNSNSSSRNSFNEITGRAIDSTLGGLGGIAFSLIIMAILVFMVLILIISYIINVFTFIFIDAAVKKDYSIRKSFSENSARGLFLLFFNIVVGIISILVMGLIFLPLIVEMVKGGSPAAPFVGLGVLQIIGKLAIYVILFMIWMMIFNIFMVFVYDFSIVDAYQNKIGITHSVRRTFARISSQKLEAFVYLLARIVLGIAIGIISMLIILVILLLLLLPMILLIMVLGILVAATGVIGLIVVIPLAMILLFGLIYLLSVILLPLSVFSLYFGLLGYEKLYKTNLVTGPQKDNKKISTNNIHSRLGSKNKPHLE